jgi:hypothetical protein
MEMFIEAHYQRAYQRGKAWAEEAFRGLRATGRAVPPELPLSKHEAAALLEQPFTDRERQPRAASVLYAAARVRWRRLVSVEINQRVS